MAKVIMTSSEFIERAKALAARPSYYSNKYPYNLCYIHKDGRTSADCWNLYKAILNGYDVTRKDVGYYQKDLSNTGDCDGATLISKCSDVSTNFSKLKEGEPRLLYMSGHAGAFIGLNVIGGKEYNVIESTGAWERKILYSWVDADGTRRRYKGGEAKGKWAKHGKMTPWVKYDAVATVQPEPAPVKEPVKNLDEKALQVYRGKYGNEPQRSQKLKAEGFTTQEIKTIQKKVNELYKANTTTPKEEPKIIHTVKSGDNLTMIARMYGTTILAILKLNPDIKDPNVIWIGQKIRVK